MAIDHRPGGLSKVTRRQNPPRELAASISAAVVRWFVDDIKYVIDNTPPGDVLPGLVAEYGEEFAYKLVNATPVEVAKRRRMAQREVR